MRYTRIVLVVAITLGTVAFAIDGLSSATPTQEITGTYAMWHRDDFAHGRALQDAWVVDTGKQLVKVDLEDSRALGKKLRLRGNFTQENGETVFQTSSAEPVNAAAASTSVTPGVKRIAVVLLNFTNDRTQPWTPAAVHGVVFDNSDSVNAYYQTASSGQVSLTGDVLGFYPISLDNSGCNVSGWRNAANTAVAAAGVNLANYSNVAYVWPHASSCGWAGMAGMPGNNLFINGSMMAGTISHELGHNFGMNHAQGLSCTSGTTKVALSDSCTTSEYGDPFDNMGGGYNAMLSNWHLAELGWRNPQTITASGTYTIAPLANATGPCLLRIARGGGNYLNLEFRQPLQPFENYTSTYPVTNGVTIRVAPDPSGAIAPTKLVDTTPNTATWWDAPLAVGQTFSDQYGTSASNVQITTLSVSPTGATVQVTFPIGTAATTTTTTAPPTTTTTTRPPTTTTTVPPTTTTTRPPTTTTTTPTTTTLPPTTTTTTTTTLPATGSPGFVKLVASGTKSQSGNSTMTLTVPAGGSAATGHRVIVSASVSTFGGTVSCRDSRGNTYTVDGRVGTNNLFVCSAHVTTALQAGDTITLTYPGFSGVSLASAYEFSGIAPVSPVDGTFRQGASSSVTVVSVSPALATANANDVLFGAVGSNGTFAVGNGFKSAGANGGLAAAYMTVSTTGSYSAFGKVGSGAWRGVLVAYRAG
jgi:hypothetical protein